MLIALITTILIALIFGKITYKEIKEYVRKGTEKKRSEEGEENGGKYGFFSAHAANSLGLAFSTFIGLKSCLRTAGGKKSPWWIKTYGGWIFFWAAMVGISRIFVGKHYLGDVLVGFIVGATAGIAFGMLARHIIRRFFPAT